MGHSLTRGLKDRNMTAQGKRSETSAALGDVAQRVQALKGRHNVAWRWVLALGWISFALSGEWRLPNT